MRLDVVRLASETGPAAYANPVVIDDLVYMSSMVAAVSTSDAPALDLAVPGYGIALRLAANTF
jgi:hypothetical protein